MAFCGMVALASAPSNLFALAHAACFVIYGFRLSLYLLYREVFVPNLFKREAKGSPASRLPIVVSCAGLYLCMAAPLRLSAVAGPLTGIVPCAPA